VYIGSSQELEGTMNKMTVSSEQIVKNNWIRALVGGFVGTVVFTLMGKFMAPHIIGQPMDVAVLLQPMMGGSYIAGFAAHFLTGTIVFPLFYLLVGVQRLPGSGWLRGALFLIPLYLIAMIVVMPLLGYGLFFDSPQKAMVALMGHVAFGVCMGAIIGRPTSA
jgi:hypothetical protein